MDKSKSKSKSKSKTPSFILEVALEVKPHDAAVLNKRFEAARQLYNACLHEAKRRLDLLRQAKEFQKAKRLPKTINGKANKERTKAFKTLNAKFGFSEYALHSYTTKLRKSSTSTYIPDHIDSVTAQTLATRAFLAVQRMAFGKAKSVRFKGKNQLKSIEGKSNKAAIRFINYKYKYKSESKETASDRSDYYVQWNGLKLKCLIDKNDNDKVLLHGLGCKVKYCRIVKRSFNGKTRFFTQLILEGKPYQKFSAPAKVVGLDLGPSTIALVSNEAAKLEHFCNELELKDKQKEIRRLQRRLERQRRVNNPQNYNANGSIKVNIVNIKGKKTWHWHYSKRYLKTKKKLAEVQRKLAAQRKCSHGNLANRILKQGKYIKVEKLNYRAFQKNYGKSIKDRAPGMFMAILKRKAENAGGYVYEFSTQATKLSQYCHQCDKYKKKPLSQRWHRCCDLYIQRDIYSAFLAGSVVENKNKNRLDTLDTLDTADVKKRWRSMEAILQQAVSKIGIGNSHIPNGHDCHNATSIASKSQVASGRQMSSNFEFESQVRTQRQSDSPAKF